MYDKQLVIDIFKSVLTSILQIGKRFRTIKSVEDFVKDDAGLEKLDSICMQLIAIGEAFKQIDKITGGNLFSDYAAVDWKKAMGMRDIIVHHYFDIDHETVYHVCKDRIPEMEKMVTTIVRGLEVK